MRFAVVSIVAAILFSIATLAPGGANADPGSVIDFEGLAEGTIVSSVANGSGISGDVQIGAVGVFGDSANPNINTNAAMIFDAACPGGCSGGDNDLLKPALGKILIMSEDLDSNDPDDADLVGAPFTFDFSGWGSGIVTVQSLDVLDIEADEPGAKIELYENGPGGTLLATIPIPPTGNNGTATIAVNVAGVDFMRVTLNGSGAIDNIRIVGQPPPPGEGGRMTGGGSVFKMPEHTRVTRGFEIHCDLSEPNNIQVNWPAGNNFHLTQLTSAVCTEDPNIHQEPPAANFDTFTGSGTGKLNNVPGATINFVFVDAGEPGTSDTASIQILDQNNVEVLFVSGFLTFGNLQAHSD